MRSPAPSRATAASRWRWAREAEIPRAIANLRFFAHAATQFASESHHGEAGLNYTLRQPLGVVATISPWNLPLYLFTGRSPRPWPPATPWWPSRPRSRR
jgi:acyl-CoA reductase-like NAD-dependent aldehyde dehydrogenase